MNNVLAVIVTYNRIDMLKRSIAYMLKQDYPCDILIVDNNSSDGTGEWVMKFAGKYQPAPFLGAKDRKSSSSGIRFKVRASFGNCMIMYQNTRANLGGAGGFHYGMNRACQMHYEYVWIMDDDAFVNRTTLSALFEMDELLGGPENYGYLASTVLWTDGTECKMNRHRINRRYYEDFDKLQYTLIPVETSTFVSMLIPVRVIREVGLPLKEYFIWGDDVEYTMRITVKYGLKSYAVGKSIITHAMKQNIGSDISIDNLDRINNYKRAFRNENHTYRQYGFKGFMRYILRCGRFGMNVLTKSKDHRLLRLWVIVSRFFSGFFFNPSIDYPDR